MLRTDEISNPTAPASEAEKLGKPARAGGFDLPRLAKIMIEAFPRLLGALLLFTASQKAINDSGVVQVLEFNRIPEMLNLPLVSLIIVAESAIGLLLIVRPKLPAVLIAAAVLLGIYTLQLGWLALFREAPDCHCIAAWKSYHSARFSNLMGIGRNICLILPLLWIRSRVRGMGAPPTQFL